MGAALWASVAPAACGDDAPSTGAGVPIGQRTDHEPAPHAQATHAYSARRCGECHGKTAQTWAASAHARADTSPTYRAMRSASGRDDCDRCHAPLRALIDDERLAGEGVTCDVCHTLRDVGLDPRATTLDFDLEGATRYGPLCYREDHYFHKMGCLPLYSESRMCGSCHLWTTHTSAAEELAVLSTYSDWEAGPYAAAGQTCQGCHMSAKAGEVAVGWGTRTSASDHGMFGPQQELRGRAIGLKAEVQVDRELEVDLAVTNKGAGHPIPAGLAGRRIIARVTAQGSDGDAIAVQERVYGKILVDQSGAEVPFYAAHHIQTDSRIFPQQTRRERFSFDRTGVVEVRVEIFDQMIAPTVAAIVGIPTPEPTLLVERRLVSLGRGRWEAREEAPRP